MEVSYGADGQGSLSGPIYDGTSIRQSFVAEGKLLLSILVYFHTHGTNNPGEIVVEVIEPVSKLHSISIVDSESIVDCEWRDFPLKLPLVVGRKYEMRVWSKFCRAGAAPSCLIGDQGNRSGGYLFVGPKLTSKKELRCKFVYSWVQ